MFNINIKVIKDTELQVSVNIHGRGFGSKNRALMHEWASSLKLIKVREFEARIYSQAKSRISQSCVQLYVSARCGYTVGSSRTGIVHEAV